MDVKAFMGVMLLTGTANTILMKFQVLQETPTAPGAVATGFEHPYFQTVLMMMGELLCLFLFMAGNTGKGLAGGVPAWVFLVPCACDWTATTLVNGAYILLPASIIQMTRGSIVIFTCLFSVIFLGKRQALYQYVGVGLVCLGVTIVAYSALNLGEAVSELNLMHTFLGLGLCVGAQLFQASMLVYEEKVLGQTDYHVEPLQMVGMEGLWGCIIGFFLLIGLNYTGIEKTNEAIYQMSNNMPLLASVIGSIFSIAFFNWSGVTVTQKASAVARSTVDCSRTILIWVIELALHWNKFSTMQLVGFVVLACGTLMYNRILVVPGLQEDEAAVRIIKKEEDKQAV